MKPMINCIYIFYHGVQKTDGTVENFGIPKGCALIGSDIDDWSVCLTCRRFKKGSARRL